MKIQCCDKPCWVGDEAGEHCAHCGTSDELVMDYLHEIARLKDTVAQLRDRWERCRAALQEGEQG